MKYQTRNVNNLNKLADNTKAVAFKWYQYCIDNGIEVLIYETIRTVEQQREYVRKGASQTMRSYHLVGQALDFVP
ncbi:M15 family metallopeptidase, partial [Bacillus cereus]